MGKPTKPADIRTTMRNLEIAHLFPKTKIKIFAGIITQVAVTMDGLVIRTDSEIVRV